MDTEIQATFAAIRERYLSGCKLPSPSEIGVIFDELDWLTRHYKALDTENARLHGEVERLADELSGTLKSLESEVLDWQDKAMVLEQDLELAKLRLAARETST